MDRLVLFSSGLQIIIWSLQACLSSVNILLAAVAISLGSSALVFNFLVPKWVKLWNNNWFPIEAKLINFVLAVATFLYGLIFVGYAHLDAHLDRVIEAAHKDASAPFAEWRQVGFKKGFNILDVGDVCIVLRMQMPEIHSEIIKQEPFRSWTIDYKKPLDLKCENMDTQPTRTVFRDDKHFQDNFEEAFDSINKQFKNSYKNIANEAVIHILYLYGICCVLCFLYFSTMAYCDITDHRNPN